MSSLHGLLKTEKNQLTGIQKGRQHGHWVVVDVFSDSVGKN